MAGQPLKLTPEKVANDIAPMLLAALAFILFWPRAGAKAPADFMNYWSASRGLLTGVNPYDGANLIALQKAGGTAYEGLLLLNPPPLLLFIFPLSLMTPVVSVIVWCVATALVYWLLARRIAPQSQWIIALFPAAYWTGSAGQTGFLTAALLIGAALTFQSRPRLSGVLVGLMIIKPHFAVLMPLLLYRKWSAFIAAAVSVVAVWGLAELVFPGSTANYLHQNVAGALEGREFLIDRIRSVYVGALALGAPAPLAAVLQGISALLAAAATFMVSRGERPALEKFAVALAATPLVIPYFYDYDLMFLILPIMVVARRHFWIAAALFLMPAYAFLLYPAPIHQIGYVVMLSVLLWDGRAARTAEAEPISPPEAQPAAP